MLHLRHHAKFREVTPSAKRRPSPARWRPLRFESLERRIVLSHTNPNATQTVGVYDENVIEPNTVDFVATGSSMTSSQFASDVATAFSSNLGGVINGSVLGAYHAFGSGHTKVLRITAAEGTNLGIGSAYHISGTGAFSSTSDGGYDYTSIDFVEIAGGAANERVVAFGVTALSITNRNYGNVTVTARLAGGGTLSAVRQINNTTGQGDTFYGLRAPTGDYVTGFSLRYDGPITGTPDTRLWFDDIGFVTAVVNPTNRLPVANDDEYTGTEDVPLSISAPGVLANDSDADADALRAILVAQPANGTVSLNNSGAFLYIPVANFHGVDSFTYKTNDGTGDSNIATVAINVRAINDAPFVDSPALTIDEDAALSGQIAYLDVEGDLVEFTLESPASHGTAVMGLHGSFTYTPAANYHGSDSFSYRATDEWGASRTGTATIEVLPVNDPPVARDDSFDVDEDGELVLSAIPLTRLQMASEPGDYIGQGLNYDFVSPTATFMASKNFDNGASFDVSQVSQFWGVDFAAPGEVLLMAGSYPNARRFPFQGSGNPGLSVSGNGRGCNTLTGQFTVYSANWSADQSTLLNFAAIFEQHCEGDPEALTGSIRYNSAIGTGAGVLSNDEDVDGDWFTAQLVSGPAHGALSLNPDGSLTYTPHPGYSGSDSFTYRPHDGIAHGNEATVTITVNGVNDPPLASDDEADTQEDAAVDISVLANDSDPDADSLSITGVTQPSHGSAFIRPDGTIRYTPAPDFFGTDSFSYTISDGKGGSDTATVTVDVAAVNDAPIAAVPQAQTAAEDVPHLITGISVADIDAGDAEVQVTLSVDGGALSVSQTAPGGLPSGGISGNGSTEITLTGSLSQINAVLALGVTYQGGLNFSGFDTLTVTIDDLGNTGIGGAQIDVETVSVRVLSTNEQAARLRQQIDALYADGTLSRREANALKGKLNLKGNARDAKSVESFIKMVHDYVESGILTPEQAAPLIAGAENLLVGIRTV